MRVQLLGRVCAFTDDERVLEPAGLVRKALLAVLALNAGRGVAVSGLVEALWGGNPPATAVNTLQAHVSYLRRLLGDRTLVGWGSTGYTLHLAESAVDAHRVEQLVAEAVAGPPGEPRRDRLERVLTLWTGGSLADARGVPYLDQQADRLDGLRTDVLTALIEVRLELGEAAAVVPELRSLVVEHPFTERLHGQLMLALYRDGRQAEALEAFRRARRLLVEELGVEPGDDLTRLHAGILRQDPALSRPSQPRSHPAAGSSTGSPTGASRPVFPTPTSSFVAREEELRVLCELVARESLVTVLGPGGVGKTRLAMEVAPHVQHEFGVMALVDLVGLPTDEESRPALVCDEALRALGVRPDPDQPSLERLLGLAAGRRGLLVLDNCEHVRGSVASFASALLSAAGGWHLLSTSREALRLPAEHCLRLGPLATTAPDEAGADPPAVQLLLQRARAADAGFAGGPAELPGITALCRRLDGLPLALELAAARLHAVPVAEMLAGLEQRHAVLDVGPGPGPRHRSMEAALEWSHALLTAAEQRTLRRFAVFSGGASPELAAAVCCPDEGLAGALTVAGLVEKSLLQRGETAPAGAVTAPSRVSAHQLVLDFAGARLAASDEEHATRRRHAVALLGALRERAAPGGDPFALRSLEPDHENLAAAVAWARERDIDLAGELGAAAWWFWFRCGRTRQGLALLREVLATPVGRDAAWSPALRNGAAYLAWLAEEHDLALDLTAQVLDGQPADSAHAALARGVVARVRGDQGRFVEAASQASESAETYRRLGDTWGYAWSLRCAAMASLLLGDDDTAQSQGRQCLTLFSSLGDTWGEAGSFDLLAAVATHRGDPAGAIGLAEEAIVRHRELGDSSGLRMATQHLAEAREAGGDDLGAGRAAADALATCRDQGYQLGAVDALVVLARTAAATGRGAEARRWATEASALAVRCEMSDAHREAEKVLAALGPG